MKNQVSISGFRGIDTVAAPERVRALPTREHPLVDLVEAVNIDLDDTGRAARRAGQTLVASGATHSLWSNGQVCLFVRSGLMYRMSETFALTAIAGGLADATVSYAEANDRIYHANGVTSAVYEQGRVRSWGIRMELADAAASATSGNLPAGIYQFAMTLLRADGQESGTGLAKRIDLGEGSGLTFSWSVPADTDLTHAALYLSHPNGETLYQAAVVPVEDGSYTYTGGPRSLELATQWLDKPPVGSVLCAYKGRLYIAVDDVLYATSPLSYEHCDLRDFRAFDGSQVRLLAPVEGGIFVGTARAIYFLAGADFAEHSLVKKADCPAIAGTVQLADGAIVTGNEQLAGMVVALLATRDGVLLGLPDGSVQNLTQQHHELPAATTGCAVLRTGAATQYLLCTTP
jgi:hypothetical protein